MRVTDLVFAFPAIILAMVVAAALGRGLLQRGARDRRRRLAGVRARRARARAHGRRLASTCSRRACSARRDRRTLVRDVLPNVVGPVIVLATLDLGNAILLLSGLSFLGLGAQPPTAEWGSMVAEGTQYFQCWWIGTFPGLAIFTVVLAFNFLGDWLRDVFDPRTARPSRSRDVTALLEVEDLRVGCRRRAGRSRSSTASTRREPGEVFGDRRRERQRQDDHDARAARPAASGSRSTGAARFGGRDLLAMPRRQLRASPRPPDRDGVPGPDDVAAPDAQRSDAADRARAGPPRPRPARRATRARSSCSTTVRIPDPRAALRALPAPVLRRDAPAHRDRDRARLPTRDC